MKPLISSPFRFIWPLLALSLTAAGLASPGSDARAMGLRASLSSLTLSSSDVQHAFGGGFTAYSYSSRNATASSSSGVAFTQYGLVGAYVRAFIKSPAADLAGGSLKPGVYSVGSVVYKFKSSAYADAAVRYALRHKLLKQRGFTFRISTTSGVGNRALFASVNGSLGGGITMRADEVAFERGAYIAGVYVSAYGANPSLGMTTSLARLMDGRIKAQG